MPSPVQGNLAAQAQARARYQGYTEEFYIYTVPVIGPLANGATATQALQLQNDADFVVSEINIGILNAAVIAPGASSATLQIYDTGVGANLFSAPVPVSAVAGTAQLPFILPVRRVFAKSATIQVTVVNNIDGANTNYTVAFIGSKLRLRANG